MIISIWRTYVKSHSETRFLAFFWLGVAFVAGDVVGDGAGAGVGGSALLSDVSSAVSESSWLGALEPKIFVDHIVHFPRSVGVGRCISL